MIVCHSFLLKTEEMKRYYKIAAEIYIEVSNRKTNSNCNIPFVLAFLSMNPVFSFPIKTCRFNFENCYTISNPLHFNLVK